MARGAKSTNGLWAELLLSGLEPDNQLGDGMAGTSRRQHERHLAKALHRPNSQVIPFNGPISGPISHSNAAAFLFLPGGGARSLWH